MCMLGTSEMKYPCKPPQCPPREGTLFDLPGQRTEAIPNLKKVVVVGGSCSGICCPGAGFQRVAVNANNLRGVPGIEAKNYTCRCENVLLLVRLNFFMRFADWTFAFLCFN